MSATDTAQLHPCNASRQEATTLGYSPPPRRGEAPQKLTQVWPVEFGREESRSRLQYLVRPTQLGDLTLEPLDLRGGVSSDPAPVAGLVIEGRG